jgi:hypothetical protein
LKLNEIVVYHKIYFFEERNLLKAKES